jgi:hypothetical protein
MVVEHCSMRGDTYEHLREPSSKNFRSPYGPPWTRTVAKGVALADFTDAEQLAAEVRKANQTIETATRPTDGAQ